MSKFLKSLMKRKTVFAVVLALTIFGAVYGFAATLSVGANTLSAGNATVASCQVTGTPTGTYTVAYDPTAGTTAYKVASVVVTGLDATNCLNKSVSVTLTSASGGTILGSTMTGTISASSMTLTPGTTIPAASVTGVSVAING